MIDLNEHKILIVEDALEYKQLISDALGRSKEHIYVSTLKEARQKLVENSFDCIILDLSLPDGNGFDLLKNISNESTPVIILTASTEIGTKVMGLSMGAQDYISKPFDSLELAARVQNKINLSQKSQASSSSMQAGNLQLDLAKRSVQVGDKAIELTRKEFECLIVFLNNKEIVLTRETLLDKVWGNENFVLERSVDSTIAGLRKKLKNWSFKIGSIYGVGYQLKQKVKKVDPANNAEIKKIFVTQSELQLKELNDAIYLGEWETSAKLVHKLKGTFSIFTSDVTPLADEIAANFKSGKDISHLAMKFHEDALKSRLNIIDGQTYKKSS